MVTVPELNADTLAQKAAIIDRAESLALYLPKPAYVGRRRAAEVPYVRNGYACIDLDNV